jgi:hypothetical protein
MLPEDSHPGEKFLRGLARFSNEERDPANAVDRLQDEINNRTEGCTESEYNIRLTIFDIRKALDKARCHS